MTPIKYIVFASALLLGASSSLAAYPKWDKRYRMVGDPWPTFLHYEVGLFLNMWKEHPADGFLGGADYEIAIPFEIYMSDQDLTGGQVNRILENRKDASTAWYIEFFDNKQLQEEKRIGHDKWGRYKQGVCHLKPKWGRDNEMRLYRKISGKHMSTGMEGEDYLKFGCREYDF